MGARWLPTRRGCWALLLLAIVSTCRAWNSSNTCEFIDEQPRYVALRADLRLVASQSSLYLGDALASTLQTALGLPPCAIQLSQGTACNPSEAVASCSRPFYVCGEQAMSSDLHALALTGTCLEGNATAVPACDLLIASPDLQDLAASGSCKVACLTPSSGEAAVGFAAAMPPTVNQDTGCTRFSLSVLLSEGEEAEEVSAALTSDATAAAVVGGVANFATRSTQFYATPAGEQWVWTGG